MNGPYLIMGVANCEWNIIAAWMTKDLAITDAARIRTEAEKKMGMVGTTRWKPWKVGGPGAGYRVGSDFPGRVLKIWSANSVGGIDGNKWSYIAVVELEVQGTVLDKIVEAI